MDDKYDSSWDLRENEEGHLPYNEKLSVIRIRQRVI